MALTSRKKIAAAVIALSAVFTGVTLLPVLADKDNKGTDVTVPARPAQKLSPETAPVEISADTPVPVAPAKSVDTAPAQTVAPAQDEASSVLALGTLRREVVDQDAAKRLTAAQKLDVIIKAHPRLAPHVMPIAGILVRDKDESVRAAGIDVLKSLARTYSAHGVAAVNMIGMIASDTKQPPALRAAATNALGDIAAAQKDHAEAAVEILVNLASDADRDVRHAAIRSLGRIGTTYNMEHGYNAANSIGTKLQDSDPAVRNEARDWARKICGANPALNCPSIP